MNTKILSKSFLVAALTLMLSITVCSPTVFALGGNTGNINIQWVVDKKNYKEAIVTVNGEEFHLSAARHGDVWEVNSINGVEQYSNWIIFGVTISRPPYPWFIPMGDVPSFQMHLDGATAVNVGTALAVLAFLLGIATAYTGGAVVVAFAIVGLIGIGYGSLWSADHRSDNSFDLWVPYDWYNVLLVSSRIGVYMATWRYWWFAYLSCIPFIVCSHSYW